MLGGGGGYGGDAFPRLRTPGHRGIGEPAAQWARTEPEPDLELAERLLAEQRNLGSVPGRDAGSAALWRPSSQYGFGLAEQMLPN